MSDGSFHPTDNGINNSNKLDSVNDKNKLDNDQNSTAENPQNSSTSTESPINKLQENLEQNINQIANSPNEPKDFSTGNNINHDDINQTPESQENLNEKEQESVKNESIENENNPTLNPSRSETEKTHEDELTNVQSAITEPNTNQEGITNIESADTTINISTQNNEQNQNNTENSITNTETKENNKDQDEHIENSPILDKPNEINETLSNITHDDLEKNVNQPSKSHNNETTDTIANEANKSDEQNNKESTNSNEDDTNHNESSEQVPEEKSMKENSDENTDNKKDKDNTDEVQHEKNEDNIHPKEKEQEQIDEVTQSEKVNKKTDEVQHEETEKEQIEAVTQNEKVKTDEVQREEKENINKVPNDKSNQEFPILEPEYPNKSHARNENTPDISQWEVNVNMGDSGNIFLNTESATTEDSNYTIDQIAHLVIEDDDYTHVNNDNFDKVVLRIHKIHREAHNNGDYELAQLSQAASQSLIHYFNEERLSTLNEAKVTEMTKLYEARKKDLQYLKEHWGNVIKNAKQKANEEMKQLQNEQDEELAAYDANINNIMSNLDENLPAQYKKYSSKLTSLRNVQKSMIRLNKYIEAKNLGQEIEIMEQEEQKSNIELFKRKVESDREDLIKKQDEKYRVKYQSWERELEKIQLISKIEIEKAENRKNQVEKRVFKAQEKAEMTTQSSLQTQRGSNFSMNSKLPSMNCISSSCPKSARPNLVKKPTILNPAAQEFRQRAIINRITYSNIVVPKIKRPGQRQKPKRMR